MAEPVACIACFTEHRFKKELWVLDKPDGTVEVLGDIQNPPPGARKSVKTIVETRDKVFDGTIVQAKRAGWVENEFGLVCPQCAGTDISVSPLFLDLDESEDV